MDASLRLYRRLKKGRLIALLAPESAQQCIAAYEALTPYDITLEIALRTPHGLDGIYATLAQHPDALILAGTVLTAAQADQVLEAGVAGVVSSDFIPEVVERCVAKDIMCIPGGLHDAGKQLALKARLYGCTLTELREQRPYQWTYKLFPAIVGAQENLSLAKALKGPYAGLQMVYSGGINKRNLARLAAADPEGIFCASALLRDTTDVQALSAAGQDWKNTLANAGHTQSAAQTPKAPETKKSDARVAAFGEILLRLSPEQGLRWSQSHRWDTCIGGAEANVAAALAQFGVSTRLISALPSNDLAQTAIERLNGYGVDTSCIQRTSGRMGLYFVEPGASLRSPQALYDRAGSAFAELQTGSIDWPRVLHGVAWFHCSGITPALGAGPRQMAFEAMRQARAAGAKVSFDVNYRAKLWTPDEAARVLADLALQADILIANAGQARMLFGEEVGLEATNPDMTEHDVHILARMLQTHFGMEKTVLTVRENDTPESTDIAAVMWNGVEFVCSGRRNIRIVDRIGAGDAFAAGLIYAALAGQPEKECLELATSACALKHTVKGDMFVGNINDVERLARNTPSEGWR